MKSAQVAKYTAIVLVTLLVLALAIDVMGPEKGALKVGAKYVLYPFEWLVSALTGGSKPANPSTFRAFSMVSPAVSFAQPLDDRFSAVKTRTLDEPMDFSPMDDARTALSGPLRDALSSRMESTVPLVEDSDPAPYVPDYAEAARQRFNTQMTVRGKVRNMDIRGLPPSMVLQARDVVPFGQSTQAAADDMGIMQGARPFSAGTVPPMEPITDLGRRLERSM